MPGEVEHAAAVRAALEVPLGVWSAYDYDDVPDTLPNLYAVISVTQRFGAPVYMCGGQATTGWRLTTLAVGRTADEARVVRDRVAGGIKNQKLTVDGDATTRVRLESEQPIAEDDGRWSGVTAWTYAASV